MADVKRESDGRWRKGHSGNPKGLGSRAKIDQFLWNQYQERLEEWMPNFFESLQRLYDDGEYETCAKLYIEAMKTTANRIAINREKTQINVGEFRGLKIGNE